MHASCARFHSKQHGEATIVATCTTCSLGWGYEIDELLDRPDQARFEVGVRRHLRTQMLPESGRTVAPADRPAHAVFPRFTTGHRRPRVEADDVRFHRLPYVDVRVPGDQHVGMIDARRNTTFLRSLDQMVEEYADGRYIRQYPHEAP